MKKITLFALFLSTVWCGHSQVKNYTFSKTNGTYTEITGGTSLGNTTSDQEYFVDPDAPLGGAVFTGPGFPIGFKFMYNGFEYDRFAVNANGWIALGTSALSPSVNLRTVNMLLPMSSAALSQQDPLAARIVGLGQDLEGQANAGIRFKVSGLAPNRVLTVQWKNFRKYNEPGDSFNFQIRLREMSNTVEFIYGTFSSSVGNSAFQVGMKAEPSTVTNFVGITSSWSNPGATTTISESMMMSSANKPSSGLTYKWTPQTCSDPKGLTVTNLTTNSATLTWGSYFPAAKNYEYTYSTEATLPTSGQAVNAASVNVKDLSTNTKYFVFVRSVVGTQFSQWVNVGSFTTRCADISGFAENFDSYKTGYGNMADCWVAAGNATTYVAAPGGINKSNFLYMEADVSVSVPKIGYAIMPPISNLNSGLYRLKFKASSYMEGRTFDVGYFTNMDDLKSFTILKTVNLPDKVSGPQDFMVIPSATVPSNVKNLVFRNAGTGKEPGFTAVYIDDVNWEINPACTDVQNVSVKMATTNSVNLSWNVTGTETNWQYAVSASTVTDPNTLPAESFVDVNVADVILDGSAKRSMTVNNLTTNTSVKIWVRSKCGPSAFGLWSASPVFMTSCTAVATIHEDFDASTTLPDCWRKGDANGTVSVEAGAGSTSSNGLKLVSQSANNPVWVLMPPVSTASAGYRLKFNFKASKADTQIQLVTLQDPINIVGGTNPNYTVVKTIPVTTAGSYISFNEGVLTSGTQLAFKILSASDKTTVYLDNLAWEPIPACPDVLSVTMDAVTSESVDLSWVGSGVESEWQYALTDTQVSDANSLESKDFISPFVNGSNGTSTISGLKASTSYKFWIRTKCSSTSGLWTGPYYFKTNCAPIDEFIQNFDSSTDLPSCWRKVGTTGTVAVIDLPGTSSAPNILKLEANTGENAIVAMQPANNTATSYNRLRFKLSGSEVGAKVEVGYITNPQDPTKFFPLQTFTVGSITEYSVEIAELGYEPASQVLAFRNPGLTTKNSSVFVDDIVWESINNSLLSADDFDVFNFSFHPNPVKDMLKVSLDNEIGNITISNLLGQQLIAKSVNSKQASIDMSGLASGTYLVKVSAANQAKTIKVVKE